MNLETGRARVLRAEKAGETNAILDMQLSPSQSYMLLAMKGVCMLRPVAQLAGLRALRPTILDSVFEPKVTFVFPPPRREPAALNCTTRHRMRGTDGLCLPSRKLPQSHGARPPRLQRQPRYGMASTGLFTSFSLPRVLA